MVHAKTVRGGIPVGNRVHILSYRVGKTGRKLESRASREVSRCPPGGLVRVAAGRVAGRSVYFLPHGHAVFTRTSGAETRAARNGADDVRDGTPASARLTRRQGTGGRAAAHQHDLRSAVCHR